MCVVYFVGCDDYNNIECEVSTSLLGKHKFIINNI